MPSDFYLFFRPEIYQILLKYVTFFCNFAEKGNKLQSYTYQQINVQVCHMQGHFVEKQNVSL